MRSASASRGASRSPTRRPRVADGQDGDFPFKEHGSICNSQAWLMDWLAICIGHGGRRMDRARFRDWVSSIDELTAAQRREAATVLSNPLEGEASLAAIKLGTDEERRCPHCGSGGAALCTSRRPPAATARSRPSCDVSAASRPSISTATLGGSISSYSAGTDRREPVSPRPALEHPAIRELSQEHRSAWNSFQTFAEVSA